MKNWELVLLFRDWVSLERRCGEKGKKCFQSASVPLELYMKLQHELLLCTLLSDVQISRDLCSVGLCSPSVGKHGMPPSEGSGEGEKAHGRSA